MSKYHTKRTQIMDLTFDSEVEAKFYVDVILSAVDAGKVKDYKLQPRYELQPKFEHRGQKFKKVEYVADFEITYIDGQVEVIDVKGLATEAALLKRKWFLYTYPNMTLKWICYVKKYGGWIEWEQLKKERRKSKKVKS